MDISHTIIGAIGIVIITIVLLSLTGTVVAAVQSEIWKGSSGASVGKTPWNFTGYSGASAMLGLVPFVWIAGVLISAAVGMLMLYKGGQV